MPKSKILIADDNVPNVELLEAYLDGLDCEIAVAVDGRDTLAKVAEFQPDLILLDVMMPGIDGGEVAAKIKEDKRLANIPVVFLSAIVKKEETQPTGGNIGGLTFLAKPVKLDDLITCIENHLGK